MSLRFGSRESLCSARRSSARNGASFELQNFRVAKLIVQGGRALSQLRVMDLDATPFNEKLIGFDYLPLPVGFKRISRGPNSWRNESDSISSCEVFFPWLFCLAAQTQVLFHRSCRFQSSS